VKNIKHTIVIVLFAFTSNLFLGQSAFDKFEEMDEITSVVVSKKMFEMMANVKTNNKEGQEFLDLVKNLNSLKVYTTANAKYKAEMKSTVDKYRATKKLEELMRVSDSSANVKIYVNQGKNTTQIKELLMYIEGNKFDYDHQAVVVLLLGNFDLNDISALVDRMNIPGGEELKKASKSKQSK